MRAFLALALVLVLSLSGCTQSPPAGPPEEPLVREAAGVWPLLSPIQFLEQVKEHVPVASFDGKLMDAWVYRPVVPEGTRVPVIINFSPYWENLAPPAGERGDNFSEYLIDYFVPRGYAVVLTSVRGTGHSEGCFNLGGATEKRDANAVIEHFAGRPWSNGNVAAGGKSYDGTTPQGVATLAPPALKAIIPVSAISELYKYNYKGGLSYALHGANFNARYIATVGWGVTAAYLVPADGHDPEEFNEEDLACPDLPVIAGEGVVTAAVGDYDAYWQERDYAKDASKATAAMFFIHGLQDWNVKPDHILPWLERYGGPKKVWLHQWTDAGTGHVYPMRDDWNYTMLRFLDHTLKGIDTGLFEEPAVQVQDTQRRWRHEDAWPPATAQKGSFHLAGGKLTMAPGAGQVSFVDDGMGPSGSSSGENQLVYASEPVPEDLRLVGEPVVRLRVASDRTVGKIGVSLSILGPSAEDGIEAYVENWGGLNLRHRDDVRLPKEIVPNAWYDVLVPLFPQDTVVPKGSRIVLALAGNADGESFDPIVTNARITIDESRSSFEYRWQRAEDLRFEEPQPPDLASCWAC